eukprot:11440938-Prorocentrum_lima.AAC.1
MPEEILGELLQQLRPNIVLAQQHDALTRGDWRSTDDEPCYFLPPTVVGCQQAAQHIMEYASHSH